MFERFTKAHDELVERRRQSSRSERSATHVRPEHLFLALLWTSLTTLPSGC